MRDFKSGDIHGDVNINDGSSTPYKLLIHCSATELLDEERYRRSLLDREQATRWGRVYKLLGVAVLAGLVAAVWLFLEGRMDAVTLVLGLFALVVGYAAVKGSTIRTDFEQRQIDALQEIHTLLRERGAR
ncbi:hypothetical protein [Stenotrophomonas maltophilia]|uniref:hypothetical protein n=1 Tax=Stenotrophomonas maltophilia TaxID=40324 RepID=UPI000DA91E93|nr:hypothetical protein [Stenotrophomonas maltophilia]PZS51088.1 hypothetical protein A7X57_03730 [Stenotrophomonas maltophilia]